MRGQRRQEEGGQAGTALEAAIVQLAVPAAHWAGLAVAGAGLGVCEDAGVAVAAQPAVARVAEHVAGHADPHLHVVPVLAERAVVRRAGDAPLGHSRHL
jgi:hypothetical protein